MPATATLDRPTTSRPQRLSALEQANRVRLARAALKRQIAAGILPVTRVLREVPAEAAGMTIGELLIAQHRWGQARCRRLLAALDLGEHKPVGRLTDRQRQALLRRLGTDDQPEHPKLRAPSDRGGAPAGWRAAGRALMRQLGDHARDSVAGFAQGALGGAEASAMPASPIQTALKPRASRSSAPVFLAALGASTALSKAGIGRV